MKIKMFLAADQVSPSCYYRGYEIARILVEEGISVEIMPAHIPTYPRRKSRLRKAWLYSFNFLKRLQELFHIKKDEIIYVQTAMAFWGSPLLEWLVKTVLNYPLIIDIDDAYFIYKPPGIQRILGPCRTNTLLRLSNIVVVGSHYLWEYARKYNNKVFLIPTSVDMEKYKSLLKQLRNNLPVIGWTGNPTGLRYLNIIKAPLEILARKYDFEFRLIGANEYESEVPEFKGVKTRLIPWTREREWQEIAQFDIGVMPLYNTEWDKGKCAFKAIQYMALGIPPICSAVGENNYLIQDGINGFLVRSPDEWVTKLEMLLANAELRKNLGTKGRETVSITYSLRNNVHRLLEIIKKELN